MHWKGEYHLFYQYNPHAAVWGAMHWGHAVSTDLVHWQDLPLALAPDAPYDRSGVFSGCAIVHNGAPVIMYTGVNSPHQLPCLAYADETMRSFHKEPNNPVIRTLPDNLVEDFRDHSMWHDGTCWYQILGSGDGTHAVAPLFRSVDLLDWEYLGRMIQSDDPINEQLYECPDFFASNGQHVFITSPLPMRRVIYMSGQFDGRTFLPTKRNRVDHGVSFYAPQSFTDEQGRRIMIGWCQEQRVEQACRAAGWQGAMTLPRVLALDAAGDLTYTVAPECAALEATTIVHAKHVSLRQLQHQLTHVASRTYRVALQLVATGADTVTLVVRSDPTTGEQTTITWLPTTNELVCSMARSSINAGTSHDVYTIPLHHSVGSALTLDVYVDHSLIEVYAGVHTVCTMRVYPNGTADRIDLIAEGDVAITDCLVQHLSL
jgi:beta-fructofuranosidase